MITTTLGRHIHVDDLVADPPGPEELAMLRAVCLEPEDWGPKLVLADWWEEHGLRPARALLVRLSAARVLETVNLKAGQWFMYTDPNSGAVVNCRCPAWAQSVEIRDGFVAGWQCSPVQYYTHFAPVFRSEPITRVRVQTTGEPGESRYLPLPDHLLNYARVRVGLPAFLEVDGRTTSATE